MYKIITHTIIRVKFNKNITVSQFTRANHPKGYSSINYMLLIIHGTFCFSVLGVNCLSTGHLKLISKILNHNCSLMLQEVVHLAQ